MIKYELSTQRLILRKPVIEDASLIFELYAQDRDVVKFLGWQAHKNIDETKDYLNLCLNNWQAKKAYPYIIIEKKTNALLGMIDCRVDKHVITVGYVLGKNTGEKDI